MVTPKVQEIVEQRRSEAVDKLQDAFARDVIDVEELERRLDELEDAETLSGLEAVTRDLNRVAALAATAPAPEATAMAPRPQRGEPRVQLVVAVMGGNTRKPKGRPAARTSVFAMWGGAVLDFSNAELPQEPLDVHVTVLMGGATIVVPDGVRVECNGTPIMGGFEDRSAPCSDPDAPLIRISGFALWGGVQVRPPRFRERMAVLRDKMLSAGRRSLPR